MEISAIHKEAMYAKVVNQFRAALESGQLMPGDKLPTEENLAARFGVSRVVIREALSALKVLGLVEGRQGVGSFVRKSPLPGPLIGERLVSMGTFGSPIEILEARRMLEPEVAALAAQRRTDDDLTAMRKALASLEQSIEDGVPSPSSKNLHIDFHLAVAHSTGNPVVIAIEESVIRRTYEGVWQSFNELASPIPRREYLSQHWELFRAIEDGDSAKARQASLLHFESMEADLSQ